MSRRFWRCAIVFIVLVSCASAALAQRVSPAGIEDLGRFGMSLKMPLSVDLSATTSEAAPGWRLFADSEELRLHVDCENESRTAVAMHRGELVKAVRFRVASGGIPVAVETRWLDEVLHVERLPISVSPDAVVLLKPMTSARLTVVLRRADGKAFGPGDHRFTIELRNVRSALRDDSGQMWKGRVPPDFDREYVARIQLPTTAAEAALRYTLDGNDKFSRDEFTSALEAYSRAADADPGDASGLIWMAHVYTALGRYREAIQIYQRVVGADRPNQLIARLFARAYVGAGDVANARRVLRAADEDDLDARIRELREDIKVFQSRPDRSPGQR